MSPSVSKFGMNVLLAIHNNNMLNGKLITNANDVSLTDSFNDSLSMLTLHPTL